MFMYQHSMTTNLSVTIALLNTSYFEHECHSVFFEHECHSVFFEHE